MSVKSLAETVILQSLEDLFSDEDRKESIRFFRGQGFILSADIAGLGSSERQKILDIYRDYLSGDMPVRACRRTAFGGTV
jgi:hypothetical protein